MKLKGFFAGVGACAVVAGSVLSVAGPASADPAGPTTFAIAGSDTTQDAVQAIATNLAVTGLGNWLAVKPGTAAHDPIQPKSSAACPTNVSRPNGSGEGVAALRRSLSGNFGTPAATAATYPTGTGSVLPPLGSLCFDVARSSGAPGANASSTGLLHYIPFAQDAVTVAVGATSVITDSFTDAELVALYSTGAAVTKGTKRYVPLNGPDPGPPPAGVTDVSIHLLIPQAGSGTRSFFAGLVSINATTPPAWVSDHYNPGNLQVEEHDGSAFAADPNAIGPFSIAQWLAQAKGHNDRRHGAVLKSIDGQAAVAGGKINSTFPAKYKRNVFNVILEADTVAGGPHPALFNIFVGKTANPVNLCGSQSATILEYGFNTIANCGQVDPTLRAFDTTQW